MNKQEMFKDLKRMLNTMLLDLVESGVMLNRLTLQDRKFTLDELKPAHTWIENFYYTTYADFKSVKDIHTSETWKLMFIMDEDGNLEEQILYKKHQTKLRKRWYNERPEFWKRKKGKKCLK